MNVLFLQLSDEHCMLVSVPYGRNPYELRQHQQNLIQGFIKYLGDKQAAGIVNVPNCQQVSLLFMKILDLV